MTNEEMIAELEQENRLLRARNDRLHQCELAFNEWIEKTEWVQQTARTGELGMHRADVLKARIEGMERELADLCEAVAKRLEQAGAGMQAGLIREVFIQKSHP